MDLLVVTGAPGAGKSSTVEAINALATHYLPMDIDWLADAASELAGASIYSDPGTWQPYGRLWFDVLHAMHRGGATPLFFCPNTKADFEAMGQPEWCRTIHWLLLDCEDHCRAQRLRNRDGWGDTRVADAIIDATELRQTLDDVVDTTYTPPPDVAEKVLAWAASKVNNIGTGR